MRKIPDFLRHADFDSVLMAVVFSAAIFSAAFIVWMLAKALGSHVLLLAALFVLTVIGLLYVMNEES